MKHLMILDRLLYPSMKNQVHVLSENLFTKNIAFFIMKLITNEKLTSFIYFYPSL